MSLAFIFPGQGSQSVGMLSALAEVSPVVQSTFASASEVLGYDLWALTQNGPDDALNRTDRTQPAMLSAGVAVWRVWQQRGGARPAYMAGHSLGEYTALVCAGVLSFARAVAAVNFNAPGQVVSAGASAAVARAVELAKQAGAKRAVVLPVSVPSHCSLMRPAAERLAAHLEQLDFRAPAIPVINNVDVAATQDPRAIREALVRQLVSPVRWVETIQSLAQCGVSAAVECGPGKVLAGLNKRIARDMTALPVFVPASLDEALAALKDK